MIAFFDTSVHVDILRGALAPDEALSGSGIGPVRMSPVVAHELLRGARGRGVRIVERLIANLSPIEPPSWRACFLEAGKIVRTVFPNHESIGLGRLQNDVLIALTARHTGSLLVTRDRHFEQLRARIRFELVTLR